MKSMLSLFIACLGVLLLATVAHAEKTPPPLSESATLKSHGGVAFKVPSWKPQRSDDSVVVLSRSSASPRGAFLTLVLAVEEGPVRTDVVDWSAVRANILGAAKGAGSDLNLEHLGDWSGNEGFKGHRFKGSMRQAERDVSVHMVALISSGVLVTVTALVSKVDPQNDGIAEAVAATAARLSKVP